MFFEKLFSLKDKVAIVTGSNTGLGQGITRGFISAGAKVAGVSISSNDETISLLEYPGNFHEIRADLMSIEPIDRVIDETLAKFGRIDVLVNNAGIIRREDALNFEPRDWDDVLNINLKTVFFLAQAVAKTFVKQESGGKIINIASMLSYQGGVRVPSYTAAKSGVKGITMALSNEWAKYNININSIAPGYMATNNTQALRADESRSNEILSRIPAGRWGVADDLVGSAIFLASRASDYVNGFTLAVDGGWLGR